MTDRSVFTADEWRHVTDAPVLITLSMAAAGHHGPISMFKESMASAKAIAHPGDHGAANPLIAHIAEEARGKQARQDSRAHKAADVSSMVELTMEDLAPAATALRTRLSAQEADEICAWLVGIARAVGDATKDMTPKEAEVLGRIEALFSPGG